VVCDHVVQLAADPGPFFQQRAPGALGLADLLLLGQQLPRRPIATQRFQRADDECRAADRSEQAHPEVALGNALAEHHGGSHEDAGHRRGHPEAELPAGDREGRPEGSRRWSPPKARVPPS
jgi:hypothetical protein